MLAFCRQLIYNNTHTAPVCHNDQSMFLGIPRPRVEAALFAKDSPSTRGEVFSHRASHAPGQQLDCITCETEGVRFEVVE